MYQLNTVLKQRTLNYSIYNILIEAGLGHEIADLIARRINDKALIKNILAKSVKDLPSPFLLNEMDLASVRIGKAVLHNEYIGIMSDYDCDGLTAHATIYHALKYSFGHINIKSFVGQRLSDTRGISDILSSEIIQSGIKVLITADTGSSSHKNIQILQDNGIDVIVTDHHDAISKPLGCYAFINPVFNQKQFFDSHLAGCMVAWFTMAAVSHFLKQNGIKIHISVIKLLDFISIGTISDSVSLLYSASNRIAIKTGISLVNRLETHACWLAAKDFFSLDYLDEEFIKYKLIPILNSASRIGDVSIALDFLKSYTIEEALQYLKILAKYNAARKKKQKSLIKLALEDQFKFFASDNAIIMPIKGSNSGFNGLIASCLKEKFNKPVAIFSPANYLNSTNSNFLVGSIRAPEEFDIIATLNTIADKHPGLFENFGGHKNAAGLSLNQDNFLLFKHEFLLAQHKVNAKILTMIDSSLVNCSSIANMFDKIDSIAPFGKDWSKPRFCDIVTCHSIVTYTSCVIVIVILGTKKVKGVLFGDDHNALEYIQQGSVFQIVYTLQKDYKEDIILNIEMITHVFSAVQFAT